MDPLTTTTSKPPVVRSIGRQLRPKGFEPLINFTYILKNVLDNMTKAVDNGIEQELKILFGAINGTNVTSLSAGATNESVPNSTSNITSTFRNVTVATSKVTQAPSSQNSTVFATAPISPAPAITSTSLPPMPATLLLNMLSVVAVSASTPLPMNASSVIPFNAFLNTTFLGNSTSLANQNITYSTYTPPCLNVTTVSANGTALLPKNLNFMEQTVAGLRSELREVLSVLMQSIDRANWDAAYEKYIEKEEKRDPKPPQPPNFPKPPKSTTAKRKPNSSGESYLLIKPRLTVLFGVLSLLAHTLV